MNYSNVLIWLRKRDFEVEHSEFFHPHYVFCKKDHINLVLKEYNNKPNSDKVRSDVIDIRTKLVKLGENIWNTYFLVCTEKQSDTPPYSIEKDSVGLRKYVINSQEDFARIPFLDTITTSNGASDKKTIMEIQKTVNVKLDRVVDFIISIEGHERELNKKEVIEILSEFYDADVNENED